MPEHCAGCRCKEIEMAKEAATKAAIVQAKIDVNEPFKAGELIFAADSRCQCGAGMAYPKGCGPNHYWDCSAILMGTAKPRDGKVHTGRLDFGFYNIKSETQPSAGGRTTRRQDQLI